MPPCVAGANGEVTGAIGATPPEAVGVAAPTAGPAGDAGAAAGRGTVA